jgi:hypothetical protein
MWLQVRALIGLRDIRRSFTGKNGYLKLGPAQLSDGRIS